MTVPDVSFKIRDPEQVRAAVAALSPGFHAEKRGRRSSRRTYHDTFDWRVVRNGGALFSVEEAEGWLVLWCGPGGARRHSLRVTALPAFARDLPPGAFRDELARVIGLRRLFPIVRVEATRSILAVLDARRKTVARLSLERGRATTGEGRTSRALGERLRVVPVPGYADEHRAVLECVGRTPGLARAEGGELLDALAAVKLEPGRHSSKLDVPLEPAEPAQTAVRRLLRALLAVLTANEEGTRLALDPEFLHDFRVAVRRTRSCLGQLDRVFAPPAVEGFRQEFAWLGGLTGPARDLDVLLAGMDDYRAELPPSLAAGLELFESELRLRQCRAQRRLGQGLASRRYRDLMRKWSRFVDAPPACGEAGLGPDARRPIREVAASCIRRRFRRISKHGRNLGSDTPPPTFHVVRIDCKKLRYLLEFFRHAFDSQRVAALVAELKSLQDQLGDFNDMEVQQHEVLGIAERLARRPTLRPEALIAAGSLVGILHRRQSELRPKLLGRLGRFAGAKTAAAIDEFGR